MVYSSYYLRNIIYEPMNNDADQNVRLAPYKWLNEVGR